MPETPFCGTGAIRVFGLPHIGLRAEAVHVAITPGSRDKRSRDHDIDRLVHLARAFSWHPRHTTVGNSGAVYKRSRDQVIAIACSRNESLVTCVALKLYFVQYA